MTDFLPTQVFIQQDPIDEDVLCCPEIMVDMYPTNVVLWQSKKKPVSLTKRQAEDLFGILRDWLEKESAT
jgi:hypothetical protein